MKKGRLRSKPYKPSARAAKERYAVPIDEPLAKPKAVKVKQVLPYEQDDSMADTYDQAWERGRERNLREVEFYKSVESEKAKLAETKHIQQQKPMTPELRLHILRLIRMDVTKISDVCNDLRGHLNLLILDAQDQHKHQLDEFGNCDWCEQHA